MTLLKLLFVLCLPQATRSSRVMRHRGVYQEFRPLVRSNSDTNLNSRVKVGSGSSGDCFSIARLAQGCKGYLDCVHGEMVSFTCAPGLAYSRTKNACDAEVNVANCHNSSTKGLSESLITRKQTCFGEFLILSGPDVQDWLKGEVKAWQKEVASLEMTNDIRKDEAVAAVALLKKDSSCKGDYWAAASEEDDGSVKIQVIARVVSEKTGDSRLGVPSIISRRALFGKSGSSILGGRGGAGKALLAALVEQHASEGGAVRLGGTPGDAFVNAVYHQHGAANIKASDDPDGVLKFGTLELPIPEGCAAFFARALCGQMSFGDGFRHAARLLQPENTTHMLHVIHTCSDVFPKKLIWDKLLKMIS